MIDVTDYFGMNHDLWKVAENQVRNRFDGVFGNLPMVELIYHDGEYADNAVQVDGWLMFSKTEHEVPVIGGVKTEFWWQLSTVEYIAPTRVDPPDCDVNDVGKPHRQLDNCIREAVKLYAQQMFDSYMEQLADEDQARQYEDQAAGPHSWKGQG
jgi:hypothetical protein